MNEKFMRFYEAVSQDQALQFELEEVVQGVDVEGVPEDEVRTAMAEALAAFAEAHDLDLTVEDFIAFDDDARAEGEISEEELENVAGGGSCYCIVIGLLKGCGCFVNGGSIKDAADGHINMNNCKVLYGGPGL